MRGPTGAPRGLGARRLLLSPSNAPCFLASATDSSALDAAASPSPRDAASLAKKSTRNLELPSLDSDLKSMLITSMKKSAGFVSVGHLNISVSKYPTAADASPMNANLPSVRSMS